MKSKVSTFLVVISLSFLAGCHDYDPVLKWVRVWGGDGLDFGTGINVTQSGRVYVTGTCSSTVDFDPDPLEEVTMTDSHSGSFLSTFGTDGEYIWTRSWHCEPYGWEPGKDVAEDLDGNILVTGHFSNNLIMDNSDASDVQVSMGESDVYLVKFNPSGNLQWIISWGGDDYDSGRALVTDRDCNVFVAGTYRNTVDFDPGPETSLETSTGSGANFVSKFNSDGEFEWVTVWGGEGHRICNDLALDKEGLIWVAGRSITTSVLPSQQGDTEQEVIFQDGFLTRIESNGDLLWTREWDARANALAIDESGHVYVTGSWNGTVDFNPGDGVSEFNSGDADDSYLSKFNSSGDFMWVRTWGGEDGGIQAWDIAIDAQGRVYICGMFGRTIDFDPGPGIYELNSSVSTGFYVSCFDRDGNFITTHGWWSEHENSLVGWANSISIDDDGYVYLTGTFSYDVDFDPVYGGNVQIADGFGDVFLMKLSP